MKSIAIIGIGRWGKNLVRDFSRIAKVKICVSTGKKDNLLWLKQNYPKIDHSNDLNQVLTDLPNEVSIQLTLNSPLNKNFKETNYSWVVNFRLGAYKSKNAALKIVRKLEISQKFSESVFLTRESDEEKTTKLVENSETHEDTCKTLVSNGLIYRNYPELGLYLIKYNKLKADFENDEVSKCRGLVCEMGTNKIVGVPPYKSVNYDSHLTNEAMEQFDTIIIKFYLE